MKMNFHHLSCLCALCTLHRGKLHFISVRQKCTILCRTHCYFPNIYFYIFFLCSCFSTYFPALFSAVENGHLEKARTILESTDVDVNRYSEFYPSSLAATAINLTKTDFIIIIIISVDWRSLNSDGLSPLDVAVLSNNRSLTKMLLQNGAIEGTKCKHLSHK